jgi:hypothetical protein
MRVYQSLEWNRGNPLMNERILIRTITNLSYVGERVDIKADEFKKGILLKPSPDSNIKIWFPEEEIDCIIHPNGEVQKGEKIDG